MSEHRLHVYVDGRSGPRLAGHLTVLTRRGRDHAAFEYATDWLQHAENFALDPVYMPLGRGAFQTQGPLFGGLADSLPDRWGRTLLHHGVRLRGERRTLHDAERLLLTCDLTRPGALRFRAATDDAFAAAAADTPPLSRIGDLLGAIDAMQREQASHDALQLLIGAGANLGGSRPKASLVDPRGGLFIAKFGSANDEWPVVTWEHIAISLARRAGIDVAESRAESVHGQRVLISRRFDRRDNQRVPFLSARAMLGVRDDDESHSYLELADAIRQHGATPRRDLEQLWRRMVFSVLIANTDDHLRNHGFLREAQGWVLAPAFDLNPVPSDGGPRLHALALDETQFESSLATCYDVADYFDLDHAQAKDIVAQASLATGRWRSIARQHGIDDAGLDRMASAFEHHNAIAAARG